jgi:hypothetical protein
MGKATAKDAWAITNTAEYGPLVLRITYQKAILDLPPTRRSFAVSGISDRRRRNCMIDDSLKIVLLP